MNFGRKLTFTEYEYAITRLPRDQSTPQAYAAERAAELNLMIDYKLGVNFPQARRDQLVAEQARQDKVRIWHLVKGIATGKGPDGGLIHGLVKGYATVLDRAEIGALLDLPSSILDQVLGQDTPRISPNGP